MGALASKSNDVNYTAEMLAAELSAGSVSIEDEDDLVDAFKILNGYAKAKDAAKDLEKPKGGWGSKGKPDPGKEIEAQAEATALCIVKYLESIADGSE